MTAAMVTPAHRCVIAGGTTGGHLFPGVAIAQEWVARRPGSRVWFISVGNALETRVLASAGFGLKRISAGGLKGRGRLRQALVAAGLPLVLVQCLWHLWRIKPQIVIGMGSFAAGPVVAAARLMGIPTVIHEQNRHPGWANRLLAPWVDRVFVSFAGTPLGAPAAKTVLTGNPIRRQITQAVQPSLPERAKAPTVFTILVLGGSQGAHRLNVAVAAALAHLKPVERFCWIHQTGPADIDQVRQAYQEAGVRARTAVFFDDMAAVYAQADLVICRAGASTVAEVTALGKSSIFIPFPFAADNHQELNARALVEAGAADLLLDAELSGLSLAQRIWSWANRPAELAAMGARARAWGCPQAAARIVTECLNLVEPQKTASTPGKHVMDANAATAEPEPLNPKS
jgi:UDP-N-acetylglucosamine--N-acetylmuramyl-(pentapeptide) pyrophosphoryl-undecaprenol N-acetylglucosamine transferase